MGTGVIILLSLAVIPKMMYGSSEIAVVTPPNPDPSIGIPLTLMHDLYLLGGY
jgi:hypothetical protein